jgi:hypothetical protein
MSPPLPLRDIQLPAEPSWWPPAPGWWVLAVLLLCALLWLLMLAFRQWRRQRQRRQRLRWLAEALAAAGGDLPAQMAAASELLRRLARRDAPAALPLQGEAWLRFLDGDGPERPFSAGPGRLLLDGGYRPRLEPAEVAAALAVVRRRVERGLP